MIIEKSPTKSLVMEARFSSGAEVKAAFSMDPKPSLQITIKGPDLTEKHGWQFWTQERTRAFDDFVAGENSKLWAAQRRIGDSPDTVRWEVELSHPDGDQHVLLVHENYVPLPEARLGYAPNRVRVQQEPFTPIEGDPYWHTHVGRVNVYPETTLKMEGLGVSLWLLEETNPVLKFIDAFQALFY